MKIKWTVDDPIAEYSSRTGTDEQGNIYHETANREIITVKTPDNKQGTGWTAEEALASAKGL